MNYDFWQEIDFLCDTWLAKDKDILIKLFLGCWLVCAVFVGYGFNLDLANLLYTFTGACTGYYWADIKNFYSRRKK